MRQNMASNNKQTLSTRSQAQGTLIAIAVTVVVVFVAVVVLVVTQINRPPATVGLNTIPESALANGFPVLGQSAPLMLVEFANFSCPACAQYKATINQIVEKHVRSGAVQLTYVPLIFGDDESYLAAQAALCAGEQSAFWPFHDVLYAIHSARGPRAFTLPLLEETATMLGLDAPRLRACMQTGKTAPIVQRAIDLARATNIEYTPTLMYSTDGGATLQWFESAAGVRYESRVPLEEIDRLLAAR
jgi:protein-disulfide isomerase